MRKFLCTLALLLAALPGTQAQAQVYFGSGSTKPINPGAASAEIAEQRRAQPPTRPRVKLVRCRDGSRHTARVCKRHGGVARRN